MASEAKATPTYVFTYFNGRGLGEISRLLFAAAGVPYQDIRVEQGAGWEALKASTPFGQLPTLSVNGKVFAQSAAIQRYIAREYGLFGSNELEGLQIDGIYEGLQDARKPFMEARSTKDEAEKKVKIAAFFKDTWPTWGARLSNVLAANDEGKSWFVGTKISLADIAVFNVLSFLLEINADYLNDYPLLQGLIARVKANPGIAAWLAKRPVTAW